MPTPVTINNPEAIIAALECASNEQTRYYLNGVALDFANNCAVATDGSRLAKIRLLWSGVGEGVPILPTETVKKIAKLAKAPKRDERGNSAGFYPVTLDFEAKQVRIEATGDTFPLELIDGAFPDYVRVVPDPAKITAAPPTIFNADLLASMAKIGKVLNCSTKWRMVGAESDGSPYLWSYVSDAATADFVVMPMRR